MKRLWVGVMLFLGVQWLSAQQPTVTADPGEKIYDWNESLSDVAESLVPSPAPSPGGSSSQPPRDYKIGPEDLMEVSVFEVPELSRTVRVSAGGAISLPLIGTVPVVGLSPLEVERKLTDKLRQSYIKDPQVTVFLKEFRSDPVSIVGAVKMPGLYYIQTEKSLIEVLAMAQGFSDAPNRMPGQEILITHKARAGQPRATASLATTDSLSPETSVVAADGNTGWAEVVEVPIKQLLESGDPKWNVPIYPGDVVRVVQAGTFYVAGDVNHPGGFPLTDFEHVTTLQALAMAGGATKSAKMGDAIIIRRDANGNRVETKVDLKKIERGKAEDLEIGDNDILFVPGSVSKQAVLRAVEATIQVATGILIWRR
ncbi:MAG: polysaccharide biosynthesis/export family protein [Acidobacteria bacterium]|nr:polysaccharide biosynthesis/export family protein [Acidobacteriota bacterium]